MDRDKWPNLNTPERMEKRDGKDYKMHTKPTQGKKGGHSIPNTQHKNGQEENGLFAEGESERETSKRSKERGEPSEKEEEWMTQKKQRRPRKFRVKTGLVRQSSRIQQDWVRIMEKAQDRTKKNLGTNHS